MHTLGALASGYADNLLIRAAEVTMKERRPLIVVPRETPMTLIHLENMERIARAGAIVVPAMPAFYQRPKTLDDIINHLVGKVLDLLGIENNLFSRWEGLEGKQKSELTIFSSFLLSFSQLHSISFRLFLFTSKFCQHDQSSYCRKGIFEWHFSQIYSSP